ncbi:hypothetical protein D3C81_1074690 [compost metagenome]
MRAGPDGGAEAVLEAGLGEQRPGLVEVGRIAGQVLGVAPGVGWVRTIGGNGGIFEHSLEVAGLVEGEVDGLAHLRLVQRRVLAIDGDESSHEGFGLFYLQGRILAGRGDIQRFWRQGDLALVALEFLQAHVGVGGDGEDQWINPRLAGKVVRVGPVADYRVLLEAIEHERPGADWLAVELLRSTGLEQLVGVLGGVDRGKAHTQGGQESGVGVIEGKAHGQRVYRLDLLDQAGQLQ